MVGLRAWWKANRLQAELTRRSIAINDDEDAIADQIPELSGMGFVRGGAYVLDQIKAFGESADQEQSDEFARRLIASQESWKSEGLTMPYWGNLVILRRYQHELDKN